METTLESIVCSSCNTENPANHQFCENCGAALNSSEETENIEKQKASNKMKVNADISRQLANRRFDNSKRVNAKAEIAKGRVAIMIVAVLTFIGALITHMSTNNQIAEARANPAMIIDEQAVSTMNMIIYASYILGVVFVGLWFWAKQNPFSAFLTALVIYIACHATAAAIDINNLYRGIIIKAVIIILLVGAVKSALKIRGMQVASN